jgi:hypothetical protein
MFWKKKKVPGKPAKTREELLAEAKENARKARENIGDETLNRIAAAMQKRQMSATEQARDQIKKLDKDKVADHIRAMIEEK